MSSGRRSRTLHRQSAKAPTCAAQQGDCCRLLELEASAQNFRFPDGTRRYATFMMLAAVEKAMRRRRETGESLGGRYFWCSDLVIISRPGFRAMADTIRDLIDTGESPAHAACSSERPPFRSGTHLAGSAFAEANGVWRFPRVPDVWGHCRQLRRCRPVL